MKETPWYRDGLRFGCTECGQCCTGSAGYVWLDEQEIAALASHLHVSKEEFLQKYTRYAFGRVALLEHPTTFDCVFLKGKKCTVYQTRPKQCRTFPWWSENLSSPEDWEQAARRCEGINHPDAPVIAFATIEQHRQS